MKKIALVGTSNSIMKDGYGQFLQELLPGQVDSLGLGACSSINAVFSLLKYDIVDRYEYVVFDFCINDFDYEKRKHINKYSILSYWVFVFGRLINSKTTPVFLLLPNESYDLSLGIVYDRGIIDFYIKIAKLFNIEYVDMSAVFEGVSLEDLYRDRGGHYASRYQKQIANCIIDITNKRKRRIRHVRHMDEIQFFIYKNRLSDTKKIIETSLRSMECYEINTKNQQDIAFPQNGSYIAGMMFWSSGLSGKQCGLVYISNDSTTIQKNFNLISKGFFAREIAYGVTGGVKNPVISFRPQPISLIELTQDQDVIRQERLNHIFYVNSVLFCNVPPVAWGEQFYQRYRDAFERERERERERRHARRSRRLSSLCSAHVSRRSLGPRHDRLMSSGVPVSSIRDGILSVTQTSLRQASIPFGIMSAVGQKKAATPRPGFRRAPMSRQIPMLLQAA